MTTTGTSLGAKALGAGTTVTVTLTDVSGNGFVSGTDYFSVVATTGGFSPSIQYTVVLLYEPSGERCGQPISFTG
jgi:hypothetical protein